MEELTADEVILSTVSGIGLETNVTSFDNKGMYTNTSFNQRENIADEITTLLAKKAIVECEHEEGEFISPIFLRKKGDGSNRLILNLKELNKNLDTIHFKMDTIYSVLDLITPDCYMASIDLKDAYYSVPIKTEEQKNFKFLFRG